MPLKIGVVMDAVQHINIKKDTTFAMLLEAQNRHWQLYYMQQSQLYIESGKAKASVQMMTVKDNASDYFQLTDAKEIDLADLDAIFMRKDPPFNTEYLYSTYILELAERDGVLIVNKPQAIRDFNEKLSTILFPQCSPPAMVSSEKSKLDHFLSQHQDIIVKPLDKMGGQEIFRLQLNDPNKNVIFEMLTQNGTNKIIAQVYIPEIMQGDKRVLLINGEPIPYAYARIPSDGETRANLAVGGKGMGIALSERDQWICQQLGPTLKEKGLIFVGIDIIGDYLTEINVTSPTCVRELDRQFNINISAQLMDEIQNQVK